MLSEELKQHLLPIFLGLFRLNYPSNGVEIFLKQSETLTSLRFISFIDLSKYRIYEVALDRTKKFKKKKKITC